MLTHLHIKNFVLVDELSLEWDKGLTALTGETGAGKSITLGALSQVIGAKSQVDKIRTGADKFEISATFDLADFHEAKGWLDKQDIDFDDSECLLRRVVSKTGKSQAYINGQRCTLSQLRELGEMLVDIHSQHEHQSLLKVATHRHLLDDFAGAADLATKVQTSYMEWSKLKQALDTAQSVSAEANAEYQLLEYQLAELDTLAIAEEELVTLEARQEQLANIETTLTTAAHIAQGLRADDQGILDNLSSLQGLIAKLNGGKESFESLATLLSEAQINLEEAANEAELIQQSQADPSELSGIEARLSEIYTVARKNRVLPEALFEHHQDLAQQFASLHSGDERIAEIESQLLQARNEYDQYAAKLSKKRQTAAPKLSKAINGRLKLLAMSHSEFAVDLAPSGDQPQATGSEKVEFLISTNPGSPALPLHKIASGGELSRISLAIQVVTAATSATPTLVFDEVDVGIGGTTGDIVGRLLRELGENSQILCVTHLAQVAGKAHRHWQVSKSKKGKQLSSTVSQLQAEERVKELARMMGGDIESQQAIAHAEQMLTP